MALTKMTFEVYYEDGREEVVVSDQRDQVAFERKFKMGITKGFDDLTMQCFRYLGYAALRRLGRLEDSAASFEVWDKGVIAVEPEEDEEPELVDPTSPEAPPGN